VDPAKDSLISEGKRKNPQVMQR